MKILSLTPSKIQDVIRDNLCHSSTVFVFSTDVAASSWADWTVSNPAVSKTAAVPLDRFIAWDTFKSGLLDTREQGKTSIPSLLRKIFARQVIMQNAQAAADGHPLFASLIPAAYAGDALSFTDWIAKILPSLKMWNTKYQTWLSSHGGRDDDGENADYSTLYRLYCSFLDGTERGGKNQFFEPSWITPDFREQEKQYIIFYPETLEDFSDYRETFDVTDSVTAVMLPPPDVHPAVVFFSNARTELRCAALRIRKLCTEQGVDWRDVAVTVTDMPSWRPYLEREFSLYCIPYIMRAGESFTANSAGRIFREIQDCCDTDFSYDSVRALVLDACIPWKEPEVNRNLVKDGYETKCLCNYREQPGGKDIWEESLSSINTGDKDERELILYKKLKSAVKSLCDAGTFSAVRDAWNRFKAELLDRQGFTPQADLILSRCITALTELIDIEEKYMVPFGMKCESPYRFFLNEIEQKTYQPQQKLSGVSVFPYRLSSEAYFKYQFVLNANQNDATVMYRSMPFLRKQKRDELLGMEEKDTASDAFIRLYAEKGTAFFSGSEETFTGFAIPYSFLHWPSDKAERAKLTAAVEAETAPFDFISIERRSFYQEPAVFSPVISRLQKDTFARWSASAAPDGAAYSLPPALQNLIAEKYYTARGADAEYTDVLHISQADLKDFFPCPRKWILHHVFSIEEQSLDTDLMGPFDEGDISHKILELYMRGYCSSGKPLPVTGEDGLLPDEDTVRNDICAYAQQAFADTGMNFHQSPLVRQVLASQTAGFADRIMSFLRILCRPHDALRNRGFGGSTVLSVEDWRNVPFMQDGRIQWVYTGKLDCVLLTDDDETSVIDYKNTTGSIPPARDCFFEPETGSLGNFQMAVYVKLWNGSHTGAEGSSAADAVENAVFFAIRDCEKKPVFEKDGRSADAAAFQPTVEALDTLFAHSFYQCITDGKLNADGSMVKPYQDCIACQYKTVCRTAYTAAGEKL